jgi:hypothetical protein
MHTSPDAGHESNLRRHERIPARIPILLVVKSDAQRVDHEAITLNLSQLGVRVRTDAVLVPGQVVEIISKLSPRYVHSCRVVWSGPAGSSYEGESGLEVLDPPPRLG